MFPFIDCQGLGGAYTLGTVQTGKFKLVHRASLREGTKLGFGDEIVDANRHLLGDEWDQDEGHDQDDWEPGMAAYLCGTPPCSGFSNLNTRMERGPGAPINRCMWSLVEYAAACTGTDLRPGPQVVSFESVQGAYTKGRSLMRALREHLEDLTGQEYDLHHVMMSGGTVGAAQYRHRYFVVFSRIQFGIDPPQREDLPDGHPVTYFDAIGDLQGLENQWEPQDYKYAAQSNYARALRDPSGLVDCHATADGKAADTVREACLRGWKAGKYLSEAFDALDYHPPEFQKSRREGGIRRGDSTYKGLNWPLKINPDKPGYVQTGGCARDFAHWSEPRLLTIRELGRMMGYPDSWKFPHSITKSGMLIGKCCPAPSGRWISGWVARALEGSPGQVGSTSDGRGAKKEDLEPAEYLHNCSLTYKKWL